MRAREVWCSAERCRRVCGASVHRERCRRSSARQMSPAPRGVREVRRGVVHVLLRPTRQIADRHPQSHQQSAKRRVQGGVKRREGKQSSERAARCEQR